MNQSINTDELLIDTTYYDFIDTTYYDFIDTTYYDFIDTTYYDLISRISSICFNWI